MTFGLTVARNADDLDTLAEAMHSTESGRQDSNLRPSDENTQIFGQNETLAKKLVLNPVLPDTDEAADMQLAELSMHWRSLSEAVRLSILVMIHATANSHAHDAPQKKRGKS